MQGSTSVSKYNVVWESPSKDSSGSMPIGNGDVGLNVWVEEGGDLLFYLSKTDAWSEQHQLLKLGRVRVKLSPNPLAAGSPFGSAFGSEGQARREPQGRRPFRMELRLAEGEIVITAGPAGEAVTLTVWVDANRPAVHVEADGAGPFEMQASLELWRTPRPQAGTINGLSGDQRCGRPACSFPDTVVEGCMDEVVWYHRNEYSIYEGNLSHQGLAEFPGKSDPLLGRTFGGCMCGEGLVSAGPTQLKSARPAKRLVLSIYPLCEVTDTPQRWLADLAGQAEALRRVDVPQARAEHRQWWAAFWLRSWVFLDGDEQARVVGRNYVLQRWVSGCGGRGKSPIKFNGAIFCVDHQGDPDYRQWGGAYWWQNTRLPYWPMLASGDFDMMHPMFDMYLQSLPLAGCRTLVWFGHRGAFLPETMYFWGLHTNGDYGTNRQGLRVGDMTNRYIRREYTSSPELLAMMLDYYAFTRDETFLVEKLLPAADDLLTFWDQHYQLDADGHMCMYPAQALETWQDAVNPTPDIAGLMWVLPRLKALTGAAVTAERRRLWDRLAAKVPPLPMAHENDRTYVLPAAQTLQDRGNAENPELYAVFPFRLYGVGKDNLDIGRNTYERRQFKACCGWHQNDTQAALLGLADEAARQVAERAAHVNPESRFPVFWGPNFDWTPDQCHGGNLLLALQTMLLQSDGPSTGSGQGGKIYLLPAWPKTWNADFKLHAPGNTTVEASVRDGKLLSFTVTPASRRQDVVVVGPQ
jgi:hypothetical protein